MAHLKHAAASPQIYLCSKPVTRTVAAKFKLIRTGSSVAVTKSKRGFAQATDPGLFSLRRGAWLNCGVMASGLWFVLSIRAKGIVIG